MDLFINQRIWIIIVLILMLFDGRSNSLSLTDLSRVCSYYFPFDTNGTIVSLPKDYCTAVSSYDEASRYLPHNQPAPSTFKGDLPYVYIYDADNIDDFIHSILPDNVQSFVDDLHKLITDNSVDVMVFDFLDQSDNNVYEYTDDFENNLKSFFYLLKKKHPGLLFGLKLHRNVDVNKSVFNLKIIDAVVDFYVVPSYDYIPCKYRKHQKNMADPTSPYVMQKNVNDLHSIGYNVQKLVFTIQIVVKSLRKKHAPADWSYSWMCIAHPGKKRKYCRGTLENFYYQGKVIFNNKLLGVFIQSIDCDDYQGNCGCGSFPATRAIYDGSTGSSPNTTLTGCTTFGLLPRER